MLKAMTVSWEIWRGVTLKLNNLKPCLSVLTALRVSENRILNCLFLLGILIIFSILRFGCSLIISLVRSLGDFSPISGSSCLMKRVLFAKVAGGVIVLRPMVSKDLLWFSILS